MSDSLFTKVPVKVQKKSGFDLSFQNLLTTKVGTITPVLCEELIPNETVNLRAAIQAQLPPLATDTFMRCDLKYEAFFVPHRLVMKGFEQWLIPGSQYNVPSGTTLLQPRVPVVQLTPSEMKPGSLADYLGVKSNIPLVPAPETGQGQPVIKSDDFISVNALPFLAYHKIYDDWYRNTLVQKPIYYSSGLSNTPSTVYTTYNPGTSQYVSPNASTYILNTGSVGAASRRYADGVGIVELRQRNFGIDRFTSATPSAQNGDAQGLSMQVTNNQAGFTIGQLRAANAIQQWLERNNLAGNRLVDYVKANYGASLSDGVAQRSILLGSGQFAVYSKGVAQSNNDINNSEGVSAETNNPFKTVGASYGSAFASGSETIVRGFTAQEPGYLFVMCTLVPKQNYSTGIDRKLIRYMGNSRSDMANPMLQGTGNEPIWMTELCVDNAFLKGGVTGDQQIFGYQERYADWKSKENEIHGLIREKGNMEADDTGYNTEDKYLGSLGAFASQTSFGCASSESSTGTNPVISSDFLQIPKDYLNNVTAASDDLTNYGCWIDSYFDFKVSMPLARYSMPTLQDPAYEHGEDVVLDRGGKRL